MSAGVIAVTGTREAPSVRIRPKSEAQRKWVKRLKWSRWVARTGAFHPAETGPDVLEKIEKLGMAVAIDPALGEVTLEELVKPYATLDVDGRTVIVHPGIAGFDDAKAKAGLAAVWSKPHGGLLMPLEDAHRAGITYASEVHEAFAVLEDTAFEIPGRAVEAEEYATALEIDVPAWVTDRLAQFSREPFPFQIPAALSALYGHRLIADPPGVGKAQPLTSLVLTPTGFVEMGSLSVGDEIVSPCGSTEAVSGVYPQGLRDVYRITLEDGRSVLADGEHVWTVSTTYMRVEEGGPSFRRRRHKTTLELLHDLRDGSGKRKWSIEAAVAADLGRWESSIDPYALGVILGDASVASDTTPTLTTPDAQIVADMNRLLAPMKVSATPSTVSDIDYSLSKVDTTRYGSNPLLDELRRLGISGHLSKHKFVPPQLLHSSVDDRHALVQGLLDTDGTPAGGSGCSVEFTVASARLSDDFAWLVRSLGGRCYQSVKVVNGTEYYRNTARLPDQFPPFRLPRKLAQSEASKHRNCNDQYSIKSIEHVGAQEVQCIAVDSPLHEYVTDGFVRTHNTLSALLAAHLSLAERIVVVAPPNLVTNWAREAQLCGVDEAATVIRAGRKEPQTLGRVTIVADSLLASRPALLARLIGHMPEMLIVDEAHRMKTITAKRSRAVLSLAASSKVRIALTGTPVVSGPHELVALLSFTGHLLPVFGGASAFLEQYCTVDRWGRLHPRKRALQDLQTRLFQRVMVRRKKADVLPFLPSRFTPALELDVTLTDYRKAVKETVAAMTEQLELMTDPDRDDDGEILTLEQAKEVLGDQVGQYVSALRIAAARTKLDWMTEHLVETATEADPVIVWVHHREIANELAARLSEADLHHEVYLGGLSTKEQDRIVQQFQAGGVPVLIAGITAAGVGLTLTHGNRAVFLEAHWTPALMSQAVDRQHRIGQQRQVTATTAVALGTIDERIQKVLGDKGATSTAVQGDDQDDVAVLEGDLVAPRELVEELVEMAAESLR